MRLELLEQPARLGAIPRSIEVAHAFFDSIGNGHLGPRISELEQRPQPFGRFVVERLFTSQQGPSSSIERAVSSAGRGRE